MRGRGGMTNSTWQSVLPSSSHGNVSWGLHGDRHGNGGREVEKDACVEGAGKRDGDEYLET